MSKLQRMNWNLFRNEAPCQPNLNMVSPGTNLWQVNNNNNNNINNNNNKNNNNNNNCRLYDGRPKPTII